MFCVFFFQATIGFNGRPSNRTVVFRLIRIFKNFRVFGLLGNDKFVCFGRGFEENSDKIQINTDLRSRKVF